MDIRHLVTLCTVVETGSFVAAGKKLGLSQSAASLQIKSLENELGVYLFDRSSRPPTPSARGQVLAEQSQKIIELMEEAKRTTTDHLVRGKLTIGAVFTTLSSFMPAALSSLRREHPQWSGPHHLECQMHICTRLQTDAPQPGQMPALAEFLPPLVRSFIICPPVSALNIRLESAAL